MKTASDLLLVFRRQYLKVLSFIVVNVDVDVDV